MTDLTDERRAAIVQREGEATPGPWIADTEQRGDCVVWGPDGKFIANMGTAPHWVVSESGERRAVVFDVDRRDAEFIAHARKDVPLLLAMLPAAHAAGTAEGAAAERERIAQAIEATFARWERGEIERPRYERGGFLNDRDWCLAIARAGTSEADHG